MACASDRADQQHRARQGETPGHHPERGAGTGQARERRGENGAERDRPRTERAHGRGEPAEERWRAVLLAEAPDEDVSDAKAGTHRERAGRDEDDPPSGLCERDQEPEGHAREHGGHERPGGSEPPGDAGGSGGARQPADASDPDHGPGYARGEVQGANEEGDLQGLPPGEAEVRHGPEGHEYPQVGVGGHEAEPRRDLLDEPPCLDARPGLPPARGERVEAGNGEAEAHAGQHDGRECPRELGDHTSQTRPGDLRAGAARLEHPVRVEQLAALDDGGHDQVRRGPGERCARTGEERDDEELGHAEHAERRGQGQAPECHQTAELARHHDGSGLPTVDPGTCWETDRQPGRPGRGRDERGRGGARVEHLHGQERQGEGGGGVRHPAGGARREEEPERPGPTTAAAPQTVTSAPPAPHRPSRRRRSSAAGARARRLLASSPVPMVRVRASHASCSAGPNWTSESNWASKSARSASAARAGTRRTSSTKPAARTMRSSVSRVASRTPRS